MRLIVGLGNPGKKYEKTRHNVGFVVLDALHAAFVPAGISDWSLSKKFNAAVAGVTVNGEKILLAKPMTYMNASGQAVALIASFYKITHHDIIVIHDEKDIALGEYKRQSNRGDAGHNGIKSIVQHIGTKDFERIRVGIGSKNERKMQNVPNFVLGRFSLFEKPSVTRMVDTIAEELLHTLNE